MYTEEVKKRFINPKNVGELKDANGIGVVGNPKCGDIMKIFLKIVNGIIENAKFQTYGCAAAIASSDAVIDALKGKTIEEAEHLTNETVINMLNGLPPSKIHCSVLAENGIHAAIDDYKKNSGIKIKKETEHKKEIYNTKKNTECNNCCGSCELKKLHKNENE
ncbi:MAG: iron-sulfur cluster assembly scaffold protein [Clostridiales bacterium]|jgi:nitrogen fixation NifU-like protein|nr:iron-sulfur cluster assembly scaffold protein [Clostridiales bacterium]